jgi:hypothetical protein
MILNGVNLSKNSALTQMDYDLLASLANDSLDQFAAAQIQGAVTEVAPMTMRLSVTPADTAAYRLVHVAGNVVEQGTNTRMSKAYCIRSDNHYVGRVMYQTTVNGAQVNVQTVYSGWFTVQGQIVPGNISRYENGVQTFSFAVKSASISGAAADGMFVIP